jgi:phenylalanyl-tRNA synthetase beta chain
LKITLNWIKEFIDSDKLNPENIAEILTMSGTEVKKVEHAGEKYKNIVIGRIVDFSSHPNADKLSVCKVDIGSKKLNIVCGAKNFKNQDIVAVALAGANILGTAIRENKIRGVFSEGMMCSEMELGISPESEGIMILDDSYKVGKDFAKSAGLDDTVFDLEVTPNRPDCLSAIGIAREVSSLIKTDLAVPGYSFQNELNINSDFEIVIEDYALCPRYSAKIFYEIPAAKSPLWLKNRLILCDVRPVNLIVDLTNYVMLETGQPLHAFDKDLLYSNKIIVRGAKSGEKIKTIDDNVRNLSEGMIVITDEKKPVAIAGIMGGKETEINAETKSVLLESANFNGPAIMRTSKKLGLRSEASNRFEKKLDPKLTVLAIKRFEGILQKITGCNIKKGIYDSFKKTCRQRKINLRVAQVERILGTEIKADSISDILAGLKINNKIKGDVVEAVVPSFRFEDLEREIDLIEEVARIYGYNKFDSMPPVSSLKRGKYSFYQKTIKNLRQSLCSIGLNEVINYSFVSEALFKKFKLNLENEYKDAVEVLNPITEDFKLLKTSLLPAMVKNVKSNINYNIRDISVFEISKVFRKNKDSKIPIETNMLGIILTGVSNIKSWAEEERYYDYYDLKGILEYIHNKFYCNGSIRIAEKEYKFLHPKISGDAIIGDDINAGIIGRVHPAIVEDIGIKQGVYYLELNLDKFIKNISGIKKYKSIPLFPSIEIDIAIVVDEDIKNEDIENEIKNNGTVLLKEIRLFDIYRGKQVESGKKSMAYSLSFREENRTLKDSEIEIIVKRILERLGKKFNAKLRE